MAKKTDNIPTRSHGTTGAAGLPEATSGVYNNFFANTRRLCLLLFILTLAVCGNTLINGYAEDDISVMQKNKFVCEGIAGIPKLMTSSRLSGFEFIVNDNYRPLSLVMFAIEYQLFGFNPTLGHLFNILFFAGCVILLFLVFMQLFRGDAATAFFAAAIFAVHPIHTEVVANIKSRDELMCFFFAFSALYVFIRYSRTGILWHLVSGALLLALSFLSKETVISFLFIVPLIFLAYHNAHRRRSIAIIASTAVVAVLFLTVRWLVLKGHDTSAVPFLDNPLVNEPFSRRLPTAMLVLGMYLRLMVVPHPLIADYSYNSITTVGFSDPGAMLSMLVYITILIVGIYRLIKRSADPLALGIWFYLANLALFSNVFFIAYSEMAERLVFFASAGCCIAGALLLTEVNKRLSSVLSSHGGYRAAWVLLIPIALIFGLLTIERNADWRSNLALFSADVQKSPNNARLWHSLGVTHVEVEAAEETDNRRKQELVKQAITEIRQSLSIYPDNSKAHQDIGNYFRGFSMFDSAEHHLKEAIRLNPGSAVPVSDLGFVYFSAQKYQQALDLAIGAMKKDPKNAGIQNNIAMVYLQMHKFDSALAYYQKAMKTDPTNKQAAESFAGLKDMIARGDTLPHKQ